MSDRGLIKEIKPVVTIPVMAKARIGHFVEAQIIEAIGIDYIDENELLTVANECTISTTITSVYRLSVDVGTLVRW